MLKIKDDVDLKELEKYGFDDVDNNEEKEEEYTTFYGEFDNEFKNTYAKWECWGRRGQQYYILINKKNRIIYVYATRPDGDGCFHNFEIKELQPIIEALEKYIIDMNNWALHKTYNPGSIADFSDLFIKPGSDGLTWNVQYRMECGYLFVTVNFLNAIKDDYEEDYSGERIIYKIKEGHHIYMSGY